MIPAPVVHVALALILMPLSAVVFGYRDAHPRTPIKHRIATHLGVLSAIGSCTLLVAAGITVTTGLLATGYGTVSFFPVIASIALGILYALFVQSWLHNIAKKFFG